MNTNIPPHQPPLVLPTDPEHFFPGASSLFENVDKRVIIMLRDGKKLIGILRSYDQFANMVLEQTVERIIVGEYYGDLPLGLYIVRGENVVLMGEIDMFREQQLFNSGTLKMVSLDKILEMQKKEREMKELEEKTLKKILDKKGIIVTKEEEI